MEYTWRVKLVHCYPEYAGIPNVVFNVHWECTGSRVVDGKVYAAAVNGNVDLTLNPDQPFVPYSQLVEAEVLSWCYGAGIDKALIEQKIAQNIEEQLNPPIIQPPLPWR